MSAFGPLKQKKNLHDDRRFIKQQPSFPSVHQTQQYHQTPFYSTRGYPTISYNPFAQYGMNPASFVHSNRLDEQYQQKWNYMNEMRGNYWKQQADLIAPSMYARPFPINYSTETMYSLEKKTQFTNQPDFHRLGVSHFAPRRDVGYGRPLNLGYSGRLNNNAANFGNVRRLPPKIRAIFVPSGSLPLQQSSVGSLGMPPFLLNRMAQSPCFLPLPPPLPQFALLNLENDIQRILMQHYANPVAVLPLTPNWQISLPMMSSYPQIPQAQQQSIPPISTFHSYHPASMPIFSSQMPQSMDVVNQVPQMPQYHNNSYSSVYHAHIPAPTSFNNPVTSNSWMQYHSASHHIPAPITNPNVRSAVEQNVHNQTRQQYPYPHINGSASMDVWSHKTPPLPPSAIIVFDEYIDKSALSPRAPNSKKYRKRAQRINKPVERSTTINTNNTNRYKPSKNALLNKINKTKNDADTRRSFGNSKSVVSSRSVYSLSWNENVDQKQLSPEVPNVNLRSPDQPRNLPTAQDADFNSSSNPDVSEDLRFPLAMEGNQINQLPTVPSNSMKEQEEQSEEKTTEPTRAPSSILSQSKRSNSKTSITPENIRQTPSIIQTNSPNTSNSTQDKASDSISTTSVSK